MAQAEKRLGLHMAIAGAAFEDTPRLAREAEERGYSSIWRAEVTGPDAFLTLAAIARETSKAELATGVLPIQIRTPGVMAMSFLTLNEMSRGRAVAGLGVSSPVIVERWHGAAYRKPVTAMRECVAIMRELFATGRSKFQGSIYKCDFRLDFRITQKPPKICLAALNPPMLRLAGEVADGVLLNYSPPEAIPPMIEEIKAGAAKANRSLDDIEIGIYLRICITEDEAAAVATFKRELAGYAFVEEYNKMFTRYGLDHEFAEVRRLWRDGKRDDAANAISDASAQRLAAFGPPIAGRKFVESFREAGVNHPVIFPIGPGRTALKDFTATMQALAEA
jgi:5,10-methylenetetrahydromethanopterin reductase